MKNQLNIIEPYRLPDSDSEYLSALMKSHLEKGKSKERSASITSSDVTDIDLGKGLSWNKSVINIVYASGENYGPIHKTDYLLELKGSLAPGLAKKRYGFFNVGSGVSIKGDGTEKDPWTAIIGAITNLLPFLKVLLNLLGNLIKSFSDLIDHLTQEPEEGKDPMSEAHQSPNDLKGKVDQIPADKGAGTPVTKLPDDPLEDIPNLDREGVLNAPSASKAGMLIYLYSQSERRWYQIHDKQNKMAQTILNRYPSPKTDFCFEFPEQASHLLLRWANPPQVSKEMGGVWCRIYPVDEN
jgi:hypothetical protein